MRKRSLKTQKSKKSNNKNLIILENGMIHSGTTERKNERSNNHRFFRFNSLILKRKSDVKKVFSFLLKFFFH